MYAQRKAPFTPRSNPGSRFGYRPAPIRARAGLAMRRGMHFGEMPDAEAILRAHGLSLAPMSCGEGGLNLRGSTVLPTAKADDIDNGALKALIVPAGSDDAEGMAALGDVIVRAQAKGAPIFAFGEGVVATLRALNQPTGSVSEDMAAIVIEGDRIEALADDVALGVAAGRVN